MDKQTGNLNSLKTKIQKDTWWSEDAPANYQLSICAWRSFVLQNHLYDREILSTGIAIFENDFVYEKTSEQEKLSAFYWMLNEYKKNKKRIEKFYKDFTIVQKNLLKEGERVMKKRKELTNKELARAYEHIYDLATQHFTHSVLPEASDVYTDQELLSDLEKELGNATSRSVLTETALTLSSHSERSFMEEERVDFLKLYFENDPDFEQFTNKYHWVQNNYLSAKYLDPKYFEDELDKLKQERSQEEITTELKKLEGKPDRLRQKQKELLGSLSLSDSIIQTFELLRIFSKWIDERKKGALHKIYFIDTLYREVAERTKVHPDLLAYYTPEETIELLLNGTELEKSIPVNRKTLSVYMTEPTEESFLETIFIEDEAQKIFDLFLPVRGDVLKGFTASAPISRFTGTVKIILNPHREEIPEGDVLVTSMTRPDFVPLMRKAGAIITDEGGITSHAAIISRELGVPCIIGTKHASKILKDGDTVEIDTDNGIVKKI